MSLRYKMRQTLIENRPLSHNNPRHQDSVPVTHLTLLSELGLRGGVTVRLVGEGGGVDELGGGSSSVVGGVLEHNKHCKLLGTYLGISGT